MYKTSLLILATLALTAPHVTHAGEIWYGALTEQRGDTLLLEYKGPAGTRYFTCTVRGSCSSGETNKPKLFPTVLGSTVYEKSADGTLAVKPFVVGSSVYYFLYDIHTAKPKKLTQIPYTKMGATVYIAKNNTAVIFRDGRTFTRYDVATKKLSSLTLAKDLAFFALSPNATYVTGYNYTTLRHELWRFSDGRKLETPSSMQSYLEFSEDESRLAFLEDRKGFKTLFTMDAHDLGKSKIPSLVQLTKPNTETEDYIYVGNTLYYLANVSSPLAWDLYRYDEDDKISLVEKDVSYGDFLKRVRTKSGSYLAYLKVNGRNTDMTLLSPDSGEKTLFAPVKKSPSTSAITRTVKKYGDRTGVLLTPKKPAKNASLFIWLHGGPQRQVAVGYHPYLSYAVYDELLERLAEGGHYVYKLDYSGSTGYGAAFRKALDMKIGDVEMKDVENVIEDIDVALDVDNVFLIGNSYGGYMALRGLVEFPTKLAGVVSINGVSDWYGLIQQIPSSPFAALFNGPPDTVNLDAYFQASVFLGMEDLKTNDKALVVWGENDSTVPPNQSKKYVEYAKSKDVSVKTLSFPDEDHILRKRKNLDSLCKTLTEYLGVKGVSCTL